MLWLYFSTIVIFSAFLGEREWRYKYVFRILLVLSLSYVIGFGSLGARDHSNYETYYLSMDSLSFIGTLFSNFFSHNNEMEFGWYLINLLFYKLHVGPAFFFFIIALITNGLLVNLFYRYRMAWLAILYFIISIYFSQEMNVIRQMLVVSIFLFSLRFLDTKDYLSFFIAIFICVTIHTSAIFLSFIALWSIFRKKEKNNWGFYLFVIIWLFSLANAIGFIHLSLPYIPILSYYDHYDITENGVGTAGEIDSVYNIITLLYFTLYSKKKNLNIYSVVFLSGIIIMNFSVSIPLLYRFGLYFAPLSCCFVGEIISNINIKIKAFKIPLTLMITTYFLLRLLNGYIFNPDIIIGKEWYTISDILL